MTLQRVGYALARSDAGAGGDTELQTDVMRFMAILSLCLVAIFALVQSVPADRPVDRQVPPDTSSKPASPNRERPQPSTTDRVVEATDRARIRQSIVAARTAPTPARAPAPAPAPAPACETITEAVSPAPVDTPKEPHGFSLRFESDVALKALVARGDIQLFALEGKDDGSSAVRLSIERGRLTFWPSSAPGRYHEMDADTVPADIKQAMMQSKDPDSRIWAVTLPSRLSKQLQRLVEGRTGGALVIAASGDAQIDAP